jgi:hypothetical protein
MRFRQHPTGIEAELHAKNVRVQRSHFGPCWKTSPVRALPAKTLACLDCAIRRSWMPATAGVSTDDQTLDKLQALLEAQGTRSAQRAEQLAGSPLQRLG